MRSMIVADPDASAPTCSMMAIPHILSPLGKLTTRKTRQPPLQKLRSHVPTVFTRNRDTTLGGADSTASQRLFDRVLPFFGPCGKTNHIRMHAKHLQIDADHWPSGGKVL